MAAQPPYMLVHNPAGYPAPAAFRTPFQPNTANTSNAASTSAAHLAASTASPPSFRAPAHKHAHHLHSIPPREKSTRTLIIDHMLWVHGRTRFAQARAELGMTDRTGGPSSPNYTHRRRPESYDEDDDVGSSGEDDAQALTARAGGPGHPHDDDEDDRLNAQDLTLARSLRLRAEGLEKVVTSMLEQPPPVHHPVQDEDVFTPPTSPKLRATDKRDPKHPHTLPNGVRLRLALGTIINDLFARQAPPAPYRHTHAPNGMLVPEWSPSVSSSGGAASVLPDSLAPLAPISGAFAATSSSSSSSSYAMSPPARGVMSPPMSYPVYSSQQQQQQHPYPPPPPPLPTPTPRVHTLYTAGADPSTANSPPSFRCPRHLHTGCSICVEARSPPRAAAQPRRSRSASKSPVISFSSVVNRGGGGRYPSYNSLQPGGSRGEAAAHNSWKAMPGGVGPNGGGITGWQDGSGIGAGLLRPGVRGSVLRRKVEDDSGDDGGGGGGGEGGGAQGGKGREGKGNTKLGRLIPRFIRLSALVAAELGREERERGEGGGSTSGEGEGEEGQGQAEVTWESIDSAAQPPNPAPSNPTPSSSSDSSTSSSPTTTSFYALAHRPSLAWYLLLAGLLTRAVLEGYLTAGWRGREAVECLLTVGGGIEGRGRRTGHVDVGGSGSGGGGEGREEEEEQEEEGDEQDEEEDRFKEFEPDELPSLVEAARILFPSLRHGGGAGIGRGLAEAEYEGEMRERLRRFYDIPASTPDLSTHMEDLAWQYPAEPVERAAVRFCEAIAKWRGKPELETYQKKPPPAQDAMSPGSTVMTIESLVHSNPTSPSMGHAHVGAGAYVPPAAQAVAERVQRKPSVDVYFTPAEVGVWGQGKRRREEDAGGSGREGGSKRVRG